MRKTLATAILTVIWMSALSTMAHAQFWPGYGRSGGYGAWGAYSSGRQQAATASIAGQRQRTGQKLAAQQSTSMHRNIQNTLNSQAVMRTQNINNQQQSNSDWWFGVQQQQLAQRRSMPAGGGGSTGMAVAAARIATKGQDSTASSAATDIIKWPAVLRNARFSQQRALVEAPYRREPKGKVIPAVADYENMIMAVKQMKILLGEMTSSISAQEYLHAEKFLGQLADEANQRIEKDDAASPQPAK